MTKKEPAALESVALETAGSRASSTAPTVREENNLSGIYCYIGPTIRGLIQSGTIYRGSRQEALSAAAQAVKAYPAVKNLIVSGDALPEARPKVKRPGNALYVQFCKVRDAAKEAAANAAKPLEEG